MITVLYSCDVCQEDGRFAAHSVVAEDAAATAKDLRPKGWTVLKNGVVRCPEHRKVAR